MNKLVITAALAALTITAFAIPASAQSNYPQKRPDYPQKPTTTVQCGAEFGYLKRVFPAEVAGIDDSYRVWVTPVCESGELMRADGNAAYLRPTIAENDVLVTALFQEDFRPEDVFAVRMMGDDTINLYVHRFGR